jgi:hypothetical protein
VLGDPLTNFKTPSRAAIVHTLRVLGAAVPPASATTGDLLMLLRQAIAANRAKLGAPAPFSQADALDSALFAQVITSNPDYVSPVQPKKP